MPQHRAKHYLAQRVFTGETYVPLRWRHMFFLRRLAMDPVVREMSMDPRLPNWWDHLRWMWKRTRERTAWVIRKRDAMGVGPCVGVVGWFRYQPDDREAYVFVSLLSVSRGRGVGTRAIEFLTDVFFPSDGQLCAAVQAGNEPSRRMFERCGFFKTDCAIVHDKLYWKLERTRTDDD